MPRSARLDSDLTSAISVFSALDSSIQSQSVRYCFRLGKFSPDASRPRPILVKFVRVADVSKIFTKRRHLSSPYFIKPDLSRSERFQQSILMQERWNLIQSGVSRKSIHIKGNSLYVSNKLHGRISKSKFEHASVAPSSSLSGSHRPTSPIVPHDPQPRLHDEPTTSLVSNTCLQDTSSSSVDTWATVSTPPPLTPATNSSSQS